MIHPTAIIHPQATLDPSVTVGPYAIVDAHVTLGAQCAVGPHVYLTGHTTIGARNQFHAGCVIGDAPQDLKYKDEPTRLVIGDDNVFREHFTAHRAANLAEATVIGSRNFLMANAHVGHNCQVGNQVIVANGALLAGHVSVGDRAFISGNCLAHQFVRIGAFALMQGGSAVSKDLPPYTIARGDNGICGLNIIGLRRAGFSAAERLELKRVYRILFREGHSRREALVLAHKEATTPAVKLMVEFVAATKRGVCSDASASHGEDDAD